ncbi:DUF6463 family protein [Nocardia sp. NPDC051030]|uniref:DUF6463 family protein n=1 Tax=Nocardia sp. NPDC051030 TaxID=3155162 RepID=UPI00341D12C1
MTTKASNSARSVVWSGRLVTLLGTGHTIGALILTRHYFNDWASGDLWDSSLDLHSPQPILGAFFVSILSFGIPLLLFGLAISWIGHQGLIPPPYVAWALAAWITICVALGGLSPLPLAFISVATLLIAAHRQPRQLAGTAAPVGR